MITEQIRVFLLRCLGCGSSEIRITRLLVGGTEDCWISAGFSWRLRSLGSLPCCLLQDRMRSHSSRASLRDHFRTPLPETPVRTGTCLPCLPGGKRILPSKDLPPPLETDSMTHKRESPTETLRVRGSACSALRVRERHLSNPTTQLLFPTTQFRDILDFHGTNQDNKAQKKSLTATGLGRSKTFQDLFKTERVGFEPTEGCPSNDFESFAFDHSATSPKQGNALQGHVSSQRFEFPRARLAALRQRSEQ